MNPNPYNEPHNPQYQLPLIHHNYDMSAPVHINAELWPSMNYSQPTLLARNNRPMYHTHLKTKTNPSTCIAYDNVLKQIIEIVMLAKVSEGSITLNQQITKLYDFKTENSIFQISMMAAINLAYCGKLTYIIETCKKLNLPVDLQLFRGELNYWCQFIQFSLNDCSEEIQKYRIVQEINQSSKNHQRSKGKNKSKIEANVIEIQVKADQEEGENKGSKKIFERQTKKELSQPRQQQMRIQAITATSRMTRANNIPSTNQNQSGIRGSQAKSRQKTPSNNTPPSSNNQQQVITVNTNKKEKKGDKKYSQLPLQSAKETKNPPQLKPEGTLNEQQLLEVSEIKEEKIVIEDMESEKKKENIMINNSGMDVEGPIIEDIEEYPDLGGRKKQPEGMDQEIQDVEMQNQNDQLFDVIE